MEKSYVTLEQKVCIVCGKHYDTNALLLDKRLKPVFDMHTTTGVGLCPDCIKPGYICLIEIDPSKSTARNGMVRPEDAYKTGKIAHIKREVFGKIFTNIDARWLAKTMEEGFSFMDIDTANMLERMQK